MQVAKTIISHDLKTESNHFNKIIIGHQNIHILRQTDSRLFCTPVLSLILINNTSPYSNINVQIYE